MLHKGSKFKKKSKTTFLLLSCYLTPYHSLTYEQFAENNSSSESRYSLKLGSNTKGTSSSIGHTIVTLWALGCNQRVCGTLQSRFFWLKQVYCNDLGCWWTYCEIWIAFKLAVGEGWNADLTLIRQSEALRPYNFFFVTRYPDVKNPCVRIGINMDCFYLPRQWSR